ncbi:early nodulin-like protein 15 [Amaranthus tricolor]|uniref:early nodulin-like protein 15 n=1 Tax=Amaranthus tricolor TaxID=29722 RepID=UPI00258EA1B5|nr:early nodulin-like protein 15 [Amaranthus tricolor]
MGFSSKFISVSLVVAFALLFSFTDARDHLVGGKPECWKVPSTESDDFLNKWAQKTRFQIGDSLVWKYDSKKDSVLQVTREAYLSCNTSNPIAAHKEDETKIELTKSGPYYFISGTQAYCEKGEKLIVVVMAARNRPSGAVSPAIAPSPDSEFGAPAVAPTSAASGLKGGLNLIVAVAVLAGFFMI